MKIAIIIILLCALSACATTPREAPPETATHESGFLVVVRDFQIKGSPIVHSFFQVWDGSTWTRYEKLHTKNHTNSHLYAFDGWKPQGRERATFTGENARAILDAIQSRFLRPSAWSYNALTSDNSNGWIAETLELAGIDPEPILSKGAWGK